MIKYGLLCLLAVGGSVWAMEPERAKCLRYVAMEIQFSGDRDMLEAEVARREAKFGKERLPLSPGLYELVVTAGANGVLVESIPAGPIGDAMVKGYKTIAIAKDPVVQRYFELWHEGEQAPFEKDQFVFGAVG